MVSISALADQILPYEIVADLGETPGTILHATATQALVYNGTPDEGVSFLTFATGKYVETVKSSSSATGNKKPVCGWFSDEYNYVILFENG